MRFARPSNGRNLSRGFNAEPTEDDFSSVAHCEEHYDTEAVGTCRDCRRRTCQPCQIQIRRIGNLCKHCALIRAGIRRQGVRQARLVIS